MMGHEFNALRNLARATIPMLLREKGGCMQEIEMREQVERLYLQGRSMPVELDRIQRGGCRAACNAIAWALSDLVREKVLLPSAGRPVVYLAGA